MDSLIAAAARSLAVGDALGALKHVALRDDPPALALRGIAMAQLGEHQRALELLRLAARRFGPNEERARARCIVAEAEVALALRDFSASPQRLAAAADRLAALGDRVNAMQARVIAARRLVLLGRLDDAAAALARVDPRGLPPSVVAVADLVDTELALRSLRLEAVHAALERAEANASRAGIPALSGEVAQMRAELERPAARRLVGGGERALRLHEVAALRASGALVVDACRRELRAGSESRSLARRPVLFTLLRALGEAWPGDVDRAGLIARAFRTRRPDESHRARLRVEMGRLRALIVGFGSVEATTQGFVLRPRDTREVVVLAPPIEDEQGSLLALLSDGAAWSTSALALALGASQRTVQRALVELEAAGRVRSLGRARARRWLAPTLAAFTTILLLPVALPPE